MRFSDRLEQQIEELLARHPVQRTALIPMLRAIQKQEGYLSDEALQEVAIRLGVNAVDVENILGYFDIRRQKPLSRHVLQVCVNVHCRRRGSEALLEHCKRTLGIEVGQATLDRMFSLQDIVCLGACDAGPNIRVDQELHEGVTPEQVDAILSRLREGGDGWG